MLKWAGTLKIGLAGFKTGKLGCAIYTKLQQLLQLRANYSVTIVAKRKYV